MKFALINGIKSEPIKGANGICPSCNSEMIAKCGSIKIHHWSHKRKRVCDSWWENETEWHREWKNNFPIEWQEVIFIDEHTNEKHIADIRTDSGLVVEFQHSFLKQDERISREKFYRNMVWIVDGTRLKRDFPRFLKGKNNHFENQIFYETDNPKIFEVDFVDWCFPLAWLKSSVPVIFDFLGDGTLDDSEVLRNNLYCLFPQIGRFAIVAEISRKSFINAVTNEQWTLRVHEFIKKMIEQEELQSQKQYLGQIEPSNYKLRLRRRESKYYLVNGKWKRRKRF